MVEMGGISKGDTKIIRAKFKKVKVSYSQLYEQCM